MSVQLVNASSEFLQGNTSTANHATAFPLMVSFMVNMDNLTGFQNVLDLREVGTNNRFTVGILSDGGVEYFHQSGGNTTESSVAAGTVTAGSDHCVMIWSNSATDHNMSVSGTSASSTDNLGSFPSIDRFNLGALDQGFNHCDCRVGEVGYWAGTIPNAEQRAGLEHGFTPDHFPNGLIQYWDCIIASDPQQSRYGNDVLNHQGTPTTGIHFPQVLRVPRPIPFRPTAAAPSGRIMSSLVGAGGLAGHGGIAGPGGGLAA